MKVEKLFGIVEQANQQQAKPTTDTTYNVAKVRRAFFGNGHDNSRSMGRDPLVLEPKPELLGMFQAVNSVFLVVGAL